MLETRRHRPNYKQMTRPTTRRQADDAPQAEDPRAPNVDKGQRSPAELTTPDTTPPSHKRRTEHYKMPTKTTQRGEDRNAPSKPT